MTETPETSSPSFSKRDVNGLIDAVSSLAGDLTKGQWGLLVSIFASAADNVKIDNNDTSKGTFPGVRTDGGMITAPRSKEVEELRNQLRKAHMPANPPGKPLRDMVTPPHPKH